jgi:Uma2 family endonuclease
MGPSPFGNHQDISGNLYYFIRNFLKQKNLGKIFLAPLDVILEEGFNVVQPDLIYIKKENMSIYKPNAHIYGVPDLLIEIVSAGSVSRDTVEKFQIYEKYGVSEYWIVFPEQKVIEVFSLKDGKYLLLCSTENTNGIINSNVLEDFQCNMDELFEG